MPDRPESSEQPVAFNAESSKKGRIDASAFVGRVPVVFAFVGAHGHEADTAIVALDAAHIRFGQRRIQLLVVVDGYPTKVAERLGVSVPLISDHGLSEELDVNADEAGLCSVIVGNDGRVLDVVRHGPSEDRVAAVLDAVERLAAEFPDRLGTLPDGGAHPDGRGNEEDGVNREEHLDPEGEPDSPGPESAGRADTGRPGLRQRLAWLTGDRDGEAQALADTVGAAPHEVETVVAAAKDAVRDAHGDSSVSENDPVTSDVAHPDDVAEKL